ncbi:MAG: hypothetical protein ACP5XB_10500 [Isosphaeraceae bacterium]
MVERDEFNLVGRGVLHGVARRIGLARPSAQTRFVKSVLLVLVTWAPLALLSLAAGHAHGKRVSVTLFSDPVIYSRFLFVVPLLAIADVLVEAGLFVQVRHFVESGIVTQRARAGFEEAKVEAVRLRESPLAEGLIVLLAFVASILARGVVGLGSELTSWERTATSTTLAGWWYMLVSLPILFLLLLRWLWIFGIWSWFLFKVSRLDLALSPTHPDQAGGLGFLGWGLASFATVLMAVSAVLSGGFAREILSKGSSLQDLKYHIIVFVVLAMVFLHVPLLAFTGRLARCRFRGLLEIGALISAHDRAFEERWIRSPDADRRALLGSPDISSLASGAEIYERVDQMLLVPFDKKAVIVLIAAALIPMVPLLGTSVALKDIISMLGKFMI